MKQKTHKPCRTCGKEFKLRTTLDKFCSPFCKNKYESANGLSKALKKRKFIAPVSEKRLAELAEYRKLKKEFMSKPENKICPVTGLPTTEIHHMNGRENERLNDTRFWVAVSRAGHTYIHANPLEAREKGWLI